MGRSREEKIERMYSYRMPVEDFLRGVKNGESKNPLTDTALSLYLEPFFREFLEQAVLPERKEPIVEVLRTWMALRWFRAQEMDNFQRKLEFLETLNQAVDDAVVILDSYPEILQEPKHPREYAWEDRLKIRTAKGYFKSEGGYQEVFYDLHEKLQAGEITVQELKKDMLEVGCGLREYWPQEVPKFIRAVDSLKQLPELVEQTYAFLDAHPYLLQEDKDPVE